jgi:pyridinium-3,5-bisthiocarboxylic acid mononucleotide nickel chelatase
MTILKTGYGIGHRKLNGRANAIRVILLESAPATASITDQCMVLECNIDDSVPELIGSLAQTLIDKGALDAFITPIQMKKQRPGILLTVLCKPEQKAIMLDLVFRESTTFGVREHMTNRTVLDRRYAEVETTYGKVRIKIGRWQGADITCSPEHADCALRARERGLSVRAVYEAALIAPRPRAS